ncbi:MAG: uracil-DNA glycosylase [Candidatus Desulfatibia sp.]|uniref:uracil-DNA glycosylase n=1 Tax=Candidatus Desulfatibia sp. TaxID=3101189 RepID=UPI002F331D2D
MLENFIKSLKSSPKKSGIFNPWWESDKDNDISAQAPAIRRRQLFHYLSERAGKAKYLLLGEAIGYQGGHFTGIPMTSERILLGGHKKRGILPEHVFTGIKPKRTSKASLKPLGFTEPTGTIVWGEIAQTNFSPEDFVLWNAFPWHPFKPESGLLSNRTPNMKEFLSSADILMQLIQITGIKNIIAIGEKSYIVLNQLGVKSLKIRHPANGGATKFRKQFSDILAQVNKGKKYIILAEETICP